MRPDENNGSSLHCGRCPFGLASLLSAALVAEGGKFFDNGMGKQANDDGKWDTKVGKEEAFYGNPLTSFEAP